jgi:hypothetical protein
VPDAAPDRGLPTTHRELLDLLPDWGSIARDRSKTMRLIAARDGLTAAEHELREAVREAYDGGDSWLTIGTILGISRQAAQQRFRRPPAATEQDEES